jgi:hypothetical protein
MSFTKIRKQKLDRENEIIDLIIDDYTKIFIL